MRTTVINIFFALCIASALFIPRLIMNQKLKRTTVYVTTKKDKSLNYAELSSLTQNNKPISIKPDHKYFLRLETNKLFNYRNFFDYNVRTDTTNVSLIEKDENDKEVAVGSIEKGDWSRMNFK